MQNYKRRRLPLPVKSAYSTNIFSNTPIVISINGKPIYDFKNIYANHDERAFKIIDDNGVLWWQYE